MHIFFIAFFDGVCGADLFWPLFGGLNLKIEVYISRCNLGQPRLLIVVSKAYGLCVGACEQPFSAVSDRGSELLSGATVSSRMAQSRYGSAWELLAWRPDRVGHEA